MCAQHLTTMCAQHLTCKCSFDNILVGQSFITFFKYEIVTLLELALSIVIVKSLSIPQYNKQFSIT